MATIEKVTVDKAYFDALLRRADCHSSAGNLADPEPANLSISRVEYNSLLRALREYDLLKNALFQGGITAETLDLLISTPQSTEERIESAVESPRPWIQRLSNGQLSDYQYRDSSGASKPNFDRDYSRLPTACVTLLNSGDLAGTYQQPQQHCRLPPFQRQPSYGMASLLDDAVFDDGDEFIENGSPAADCGGLSNHVERRTLYLSGLSERTTYRDLLSVIHGGKLLSINLRPERTALVTFVDGAAEFLAWTKRNDIYLHTKRIEVKWADRQFRLNGHIADRAANGASRNIVIKSATEKGLTAQQIRDDMEHIHNLVIIDIVFRNGDAFVSTNSLHNALFARSCMMSRSSYKGCKIEFCRDECDVLAPAPPKTIKSQTRVLSMKSKPSISNRFNMLNLEEDGGNSDEENRTPSDDENSDEDPVGDKTGITVSLRFLDSESV